MKLKYRLMSNNVMLVIALGMIALIASSSHAQSTYQRQSRASDVGSGWRATGIGGTPTLRTRTANPQRLSPYLDLLRSDNSLLGPYHSFVLPRQQIQQGIRRQASEVQKLRRSVFDSPRVMPSRSRTQTGRGGSFNNHLHYYQFPSSAR
jgi:hypothetical protein